MTRKNAVWNWRRAVAGMLLAASILPAGADKLPKNGEPPSELRLGIFPYLSARNIVETYGPVAADLSAALGVPVKLETATSFSSFSSAIGAQIYDIALIQPFDYIDVVERHGYLPVARISVPLVTQFYVRGDSPYRKLEDLRGQTIALPPASSANARMALRSLADHGLVPGRDLEVRFFNAHDSCIQQAWAGSAAACATARPPIAEFERRMHASLRSVHDTRPIPHVLFVVHPRVPAAKQEALRKRILGWNGSDPGREILKSLNFPGFVPVKREDYAVMRTYETAVPVQAHKLGRELVLGVFPYLPPRSLDEQLAPMTAALSGSLDQPVQLRTASSFGTFVDNVNAGLYDVILVQPFDYETAAHHGYVGVARVAGELEAHAFVRDDSRFRTLKDLKGERVAMPPHDAAMSRLGRVGLQRAGLNPDRDVTVDYRRAHDSCLEQVQQRLAAACVTSSHALEIVPDNLSKHLRSIARFGRVPGLVFMAHTRVPEALRDRLRGALLGLSDNAAGRSLIEQTHLGPFVPFDAAAYADLPKVAEEIR